MKLLITCLLLTVLTVGLVPKLAAQGQTQVTYSAGLNQRTVSLMGGGPVATGNAVWIGSFDPGFVLSGNQNNPAALLAAWNPYGSTTINTILGQQGHFTGNSTSTDAQFNNQKIYLWIFSTDFAAAPHTNNWDNVNEYGLYSASTNTWFFPALNNPPPSNTRSINSNDIDQNPFGSVDATHLILNDGFVTVPEPNTLALLGLAIPAAVLALRKRRSR